MKKTILSIVFIVVTTGFLSGCEYNGDSPTTKDTDGDGYNDYYDAFPNDSSEWKDTDGDSYGDNSDDFPTDSNLHEIIPGFGSCMSPFNWTVEATKGWGCGGYIESDWKYIDIRWTVTNPSYLTIEQMKNIYLIITNPSSSAHKKYSYYENDNRKFRVIINDTNWGDWSLGFSNENGLLNEPITIRVYTEIYKIK